ncbi:very short patch repair endonuclease [Granulicella sp. dw_53]|uniref:very short patch repair endonuclease n=1 Tax=Granulicella sp. dw_53 TaxID=2719792 RepID=UPI0021061608|nr:very short patch repair endonuclease [Granulicella sp. dw_53]
MQGNKSRDTKPEIAVRSAVHALGMRYRVSARPLRYLRRTADLVFRNARVAVFVDGCFWRGCPKHHAPPKTNASYWATKIRGNKSRDEDTPKRLREEGRTVLRFWSHEEPLRVATQIEEVVATNSVIAIDKHNRIAERSFRAVQSANRSDRARVRNIHRAANGPR